MNDCYGMLWPWLVWFGDVLPRCMLCSRYGCGPRWRWFLPGTGRCEGFKLRLRKLRIWRNEKSDKILNILNHSRQHLRLLVLLIHLCASSRRLLLHFPRTLDQLFLPTRTIFPVSQQLHISKKTFVTSKFLSSLASMQERESQHHFPGWRDNDCTIWQWRGFLVASSMKNPAGHEHGSYW